MKNKIKIDIWSDVVCPYCYVGLKKLDKALTATRLGDHFEKSWHSYRLDPGFPVDISENTPTYLAQRKGVPVGQVMVTFQRLTEQGAQYGIDFQFEKALTFNTLKAHQLIQWSKTKGKTDALEEALFEAHFTLGMDLSKTEVLMSIIEHVGLPVEEAKASMKNQQYILQIEDDRYTASQYGIRGVPYFIFGEKVIVSGAMPDPVFENTLKSFASQIQHADSVTEHHTGEVCDIDGNCY